MSDNIKIAVTEPTQVEVKLTVTRELLARWGSFFDECSGQPTLDAGDVAPKILEAALKLLKEKPERKEGKILVPIGSSLTVTIQINN